jgi:hypothetical protein
LGGAALSNWHFEESLYIYIYMLQILAKLHTQKQGCDGDSSFMFFLK